MTDSPPPSRILGYDLARALAILGMVLVHFALVVAFERMGDDVLSRIIGFLDGRAAATFVVLAGVGLTLRSHNAAAEGGASLHAVQRTIVRRGLFLLVAGYVNLLIWPGDILRVYGVALLMAAWFLRASAKVLWAVAVAFVLGFIALMFTMDYSANWDWEALQYHGLWTPAGAARNLFFDGFRTVFPWAGLLFFGMWLGRQDLRQPAVRGRFLLAGLATFGVAEIVSRVLVRVVTLGTPPMAREDAVALFGTESMPPLPLFLFSATGTAVAVIAASVAVADRFGSSLFVRALVATGQLAFTWYVGHIVLGIGFVMMLGVTEDQPLVAGVAAGLGFFLLAAVVSIWWRQRFRHGPLEWLMRRVAG